mgnify:CR=1 FL=1
MLPDGTLVKPVIIMALEIVDNQSFKVRINTSGDTKFSENCETGKDVD